MIESGGTPADATMIAIMEELQALSDEDRHAALVVWARSCWWDAGLMLCTGWHGDIAKAAWRALQIDLRADTPAKQWEDANYSTGRASIVRLLGLDDEPSAAYASAPFKTFVDGDGRSWIAGAVGCPPHLDTVRLGRWRHLDITDVILWDPRSGDTEIAGEHHSASGLLLPSNQDDCLTVFAEGGAFFRAWAERRARLGELAKHAPVAWVHPVAEASDSELPGALVIGSLDDIQWRGVTSPVVVAGPGTTPANLRVAALRAARLPTFELAH